MFVIEEVTFEYEVFKKNSWIFGRKGSESINN